MVRILSYNIHSGVGNDGIYDLARIAGVIRRSEADIACLQEVEFNSAEMQTRKWSVSHSDKQPVKLSKASGLSYWCFHGPLSAHMGDHTLSSGEVLVRDSKRTAVFGNAILSRFPILDHRTLTFAPDEPPLSESQIFMDREEQPRGGCAVLVDVCASGARAQSSRAGPMGCCTSPPKTERMPGAAPALPLWVFNAHLSHRLGSEEQRNQARQVLKWIDKIYHSHEGAIRPGFVLCGDLNSPPYVPGSSYDTIASDLRWRDLWKERGTVCCQATFPSHCFSSAIGLRLDHILALDGNRAARLLCEEIRILSAPEEAEASDHCAVLADVWIAG